MPFILSIRGERKIAGTMLTYLFASKVNHPVIYFDYPNLSSRDRLKILLEHPMTKNHIDDQNNLLEQMRKVFEKEGKLQ